MSRVGATPSAASSTIPDIDAFANQPVVIDNGSGLLKAGFAGAEMPKLIFPALSVKRESDKQENIDPPCTESILVQTFTYLIV